MHSSLSSVYPRTGPRASLPKAGLPIRLLQLRHRASALLPLPRTRLQLLKRVDHSRCARNAITCRRKVGIEPAGPRHVLPGMYEDIWINRWRHHMVVWWLGTWSWQSMRWLIHLGIFDWREWNNVLPINNHNIFHVLPTTTIYFTQCPPSRGSAVYLPTTCNSMAITGDAYIEAVGYRQI
jgi:hypothetical protein